MRLGTPRRRIGGDRLQDHERRGDVRRSLDGAGGRRLRDRLQPCPANRRRCSRPRRVERGRLREADLGSADLRERSSPHRPDDHDAGEGRGPRGPRAVDRDPRRDGEKHPSGKNDLGRGFAEGTAFYPQAVRNDRPKPASPESQAPDPKTAGPQDFKTSRPARRRGLQLRRHQNRPPGRLLISSAARTRRACDRRRGAGSPAPASAARAADCRPRLRWSPQCTACRWR